MAKDSQSKQKQTEQMVQQLVEERDAIQRQCRQIQSEFEILAEELETVRSNLSDENKRMCRVWFFSNRFCFLSI